MVNAPVILVRGVGGLMDVIAVEGFQSEHEITGVIITWMAEVDVGAMRGVRLGKRWTGSAPGTWRIDCGSIVH